MVPPIEEEILPGGQAAHFALPVADAINPIGQSIQSEAPSGEYSPVPQNAHEDDALEIAKDPGEHFLQVLEPAATAKVPGEQAPHV